MFNIENHRIARLFGQVRWIDGLELGAIDALEFCKHSESHGQGFMSVFLGNVLPMDGGVANLEYVVKGPLDSFVIWVLPDELKEQRTR